MKIIRWFILLSLLAGVGVAQILMFSALSSGFSSLPIFTVYTVGLLIVWIIALDRLLAKSLFLAAVVNMVATFAVILIPVLIGSSFNKTDYQSSYIDPAGMLILVDGAISILVAALTFGGGWIIRKIDSAHSSISNIGAVK